MVMGDDLDQALSRLANATDVDEARLRHVLARVVTGLVDVQSGIEELRASPIGVAVMRAVRTYASTLGLELPRSADEAERKPH